jgi:UDP-3-O-[3-hydroxymyristoyl] N-acetylglucosamine deacetylase
MDGAQSSLPSHTARTVMAPAHNTNQGTVRRATAFLGPGLHTGGNQRVIVHPAPVNHGIIFRVSNLRGGTTEIPADWRRTRDLPLCTCLVGENGGQVRTVEHLLAACYACGVDNAVIEVGGREVPILDGSAKLFVEGMNAAGIEELGHPRRRMRILKTLQVQENNRRITIKPAPQLRVRVRTYVRDLGRFRWRGPLNRTIFAEQIAPARTYGRLADGLLAKIFTVFWTDPLCQGARLESALALWRGRVVNRGGLRLPDEFARHRVLDLMGDLMLGGADLVGHITARSPVHRLNRKLLEAIHSDSEAWEPA